MRTASYTKTIKTTCGKTITYFQEEGKNAKAHSFTDAAIIYPESENKAPEYYLYGIKYKKAEWQELVNQYKDITPSDLNLEY